MLTRQLSKRTDPIRQQAKITESARQLARKAELARKQAKLSEPIRLSRPKFVLQMACRVIRSAMILLLVKMKMVTPVDAVLQQLHEVIRVSEKLETAIFGHGYDARLS